MNNQVVERERVKEIPHRHVDCCPEIPELRRLQYFYGQMLSSGDLQEEQRYFREKIALMHRCIHGYGVLCGLRVVPVPDEVPCETPEDRELAALEEELDARDLAIGEAREQLAATTEDAERTAREEALRDAEGAREEAQRRYDKLCPPQKDKPPARVMIECGIAIDCHGHEIIVRHPVTIDLRHYLDTPRRSYERSYEHSHEHAEHAGHASEPRYGYDDESKRTPLWISVCFCERPVEPVRPVHPNPCAPADNCRYAKIQDAFRFVVSREKPGTDTRCEPCCCTCGEACVLLARIDPWPPRRPIPASAIHNSVRRKFGLYDWVTLTGISWVHGGHYSADHAAALLGRHDPHGGLEFRFSRGVRASTLDEGVIDVWVVEGGRGRAGGIYNVPGRLRHPAGPVVDRVYFQQTSDDKFHHGDRVLVRLRADFVLDECCRPVDGNHVGGRVPLITRYGSDVEHPERKDHDCVDPPHGDGPWTSGNGTGGGTFESWFVIREREPRQDYRDRDDRRDYDDRDPHDRDYDDRRDYKDQRDHNDRDYDDRRGNDDRDYRHQRPEPRDWPEGERS